MDKRAKFQAQGTNVELTKGDGAQLTEKEKQPHKESQDDVASCSKVVLEQSRQPVSQVAGICSVEHYQHTIGS